jgi:hypothetical protein
MSLVDPCCYRKNCNCPCSKIYGPQPDRYEPYFSAELVEKIEECFKNKDLDEFMIEDWDLT